MTSQECTSTLWLQCSRRTVVIITALVRLRITLKTTSAQQNSNTSSSTSSQCTSNRPTLTPRTPSPTSRDLMTLALARRRLCDTWVMYVLNSGVNRALFLCVTFSDCAEWYLVLRLWSRNSVCVTKHGWSQYFPVFGWRDSSIPGGLNLDYSCSIPGKTKWLLNPCN